MQVGIWQQNCQVRVYAGGGLGTELVADARGNLEIELVGICTWASGNCAGGYVQVGLWELSWGVYAGGNLGIDLVVLCRWESGT